MFTDKIKELTAAKARVAELEQSIASELNRELAGLPAKFGFSDVKSFVGAVKAAAPVKRRKRARITDATRAEVKKLVEAGKTGNQIAKAVGISLPSVAKIKKALGLVRKGGK